MPYRPLPIEEHIGYLYYDKGEEVNIRTKKLRLNKEIKAQEQFHAELDLQRRSQPYITCFWYLGEQYTNGCIIRAKNRLEELKEIRNKLN